MREWPVGRVLFLNPLTCGIYKDGGTKYKIDAITGLRTDVIDDEMGDHVRQWTLGTMPHGAVEVSEDVVFHNKVMVPRYYDQRFRENMAELARRLDLQTVSLGELEEDQYLVVRQGHGSPSNDVRTGSVPYIKVSDLRALRVNINPTNLVPEVVARRLWKGTTSGLRGWDLITPNRASSNIGEFVVLLPGEERIVLTKEVFVMRATDRGQSYGYSPFYLLWAFSLMAVRQQWQRVTLMQTNREDVSQRYREIVIPVPPTPQWAFDVSRPFAEYFTALVDARLKFRQQLQASPFQYISAVFAASDSDTDRTDHPPTDDDDV